MILFLVLIAALLIVAAVRDTQGDLFAALETDVPSFGIWAAALLAIGAIGFVPGLKTPSKFLLALIIIVLLVNNYQAIITGFSNAGKGVTGNSGSSQSPMGPASSDLFNIVTGQPSSGIANSAGALAVSPSGAASLPTGDNNRTLYNIVSGSGQ